MIDKARFYSQFGEDRILAKMFAQHEHGACIEVGANNGVDGSTTLYFEDSGWDCMLIEPNPALCKEIKIRRNARLFECAASSEIGSATLHVAQGEGNAHAVSAIGDRGMAAQIFKEHGFASEPIDVPTRPLDDLLEEAGWQPEIEFVTIDVEGHELEALKGFSLKKWKPQILIIEDNASMRDSSVRDYLEKRGYVRFRRTGVNDWYAPVSNARLTGLVRRAAYYPTMVYSRILVAALKAITPIVPFLRRLPGALSIRDILLGRGRSE